MYVLSGLGYFVICILNITCMEISAENNNRLLNSENKNRSLFFIFQLLHADLFFYGVRYFNVDIIGCVYMSENECSLITL